MNSIPIAIPPAAEQKRIVTKVTELLSLCDALEAKLTQAESASTQLLSAAVHHLLQH
jgi:type I restriction enzyme S subunit